MEIFLDIFWKKKSNPIVNNALQEREEAKIVDARRKIQNCRGKVPSQSWVNFL